MCICWGFVEAADSKFLWMWLIQFINFSDMVSILSFPKKFFLMTKTMHTIQISSGNSSYMLSTDPPISP